MQRGPPHTILFFGSVPTAYNMTKANSTSTTYSEEEVFKVCVFGMKNKLNSGY
jgi:hypothetical protein